VIVGKSGSGKTTIVKALCYTFGWEEAVSVTTRAPRTGEVEGVAYNFIPKWEFHHMVRRRRFVEFVEFNGNHYGITKKELADRTDRVVTLLVVEPEGADQVRKNHVGPIAVVELVASEETRRQRMLDRGDDPAKVEERLTHDEEYWPKVRDMVKYDVEWDNNNDGPIVAHLIDLVDGLGLLPEPQGI
jgi:guanylate kinase